jgi:hypothetical protein
MLGSFLDPNGWPITIPSGDVGDVVVGPDGTVYAAGMVPADRLGHGRVGWLALPDGTYVVPSAFGSDGSFYGEADGELWAFGSDGQPRSGWPIDVAASSWAVSPSASVYLMEWPTEGSTRVSILDQHAKPVSQWSIPKVLDYSCDYLIKADGTFWLTYPVDDPSWWGACEIHAYSPAGKELASSPDHWSGFADGPGGVVVAWYYHFAAQSMDRPDQTRVAVLGLDGKPKPGWPITLDGSASPPAFGPDGSIYFSLLADGGNRIAAFDEAGRARPGWPVTLTGAPLTLAAPGTEPDRPQSPIVGDGVVYLASQTDVEAFDSGGKTLDGWPYTLPVAWDDSRCTATPGTPVWNEGPVYSTAGGKGLLYLGLEGQIVALASDGRVASGWPYVADKNGFACWQSLEAAPDGGLIATASYEKSDGSEDRIFRWTPQGKFPS